MKKGTVKSRNCVKSEMDATDLGGGEPVRVCLIILLEGDLVMSTEHLGPAYIASVLRQANAECKITEISMSDYQKKLEEIVSWAPDIVGISLTTISINNAVRYGQFLRRRFEETALIIGGGPLATNLKSKLLKIDAWRFMDGLIFGEGEIPMLRLAEAVHQNGSFENIPNFIYRSEDGKGIMENQPIGLIHNLDELPFPARDQLEQTSSLPEYIRISTSRGCTSHCTFCNAPHAHNHGNSGRLWRGASPDRVVDEIEFLYNKYQMNTFDFVDSTFEDPGGTDNAKKRITQIADEIIKRKLKIYYNCCFQAKNWKEKDRPLIEHLCRSGMEKVLIGIESGSDEGLRRWQKLSTVEDNKRVIGLLRSMNVYVALGFISFHPWSSFQEIRQNLNFLRHHMGYNLRRYTVRLELYPGAKVVETLRGEGLLKDEYDTTLNPLAYKYRDSRIEVLASALNSLYGENYEANCTIEKEPSVFKFETYDVVLHTYRSRIARHLKPGEPGHEIIAECNAEIEAQKEQLSDFNYSLIGEYVDLSEQDRLTKQMVAANRDNIENCYLEKMEALRSIQVKAGMRLHRAGYDIRSMLRYQP